MANLSASLCAITFQGNAKNRLQQDAFFLLDSCYQESLGITPIYTCDDGFCVAVSDGVAESNLSGYVSLAVVKTVKQLWQNYLANLGQSAVMDIAKICETIATLPTRYYGTSATLALLYRPFATPTHPNPPITIKHIGDSRVYHFSHATKVWRCVTRDHNVLNELIDEQANSDGRTATFAEYNRNGMASPLYALTDCLTVDSDLDNNPMPRYDSQLLTVQAGDCVVVCSDGVHDLVACDKWQAIDKDTDLQDWLKQLRKQIYASDGKAYDNATAIVIRFETTNL